MCNSEMEEDGGWEIRNRRELQIQKVFIDKNKVHKNKLFEWSVSFISCFQKYKIERDSIQREILHIRFYGEGKCYKCYVLRTPRFPPFTDG